MVGKGIVYDTGGVNIKTGNYMDDMKSDMAGGAAVAGTIHAVAKAKLPLYIIGLVPATDNRPDGNAYVPDDIIHMHSGTTVEVKNTDAEGRLILADALSFAKKYNPELVIDLATLTGSAQAAIGNLGIVAMSNVKDDQFDQLKVSGNNVYERIVKFPILFLGDRSGGGGIKQTRNAHLGCLNILDLGIRSLHYPNQEW